MENLSPDTANEICKYLDVRSIAFFFTTCTAIKKKLHQLLKSRLQIHQNAFKTKEYLDAIFDCIQFRFNDDIDYFTMKYIKSTLPRNRRRMTEDQKNKLNWAIEYASENNNKDAVEYFLKLGLKDISRSMAGASRYGHMELVHFFLEKGANDYERSLKAAIRGFHYELALFLATIDKTKIDWYLAVKWAGKFILPRDSWEERGKALVGPFLQMSLEDNIITIERAINIVLEFGRCSKFGLQVIYELLRKKKINNWNIALGHWFFFRTEYFDKNQENLIKFFIEECSATWADIINVLALRSNCCLDHPKFMDFYVSECKENIDYKIFESLDIHIEIRRFKKWWVIDCLIKHLFDFLPSEPPISFWNQYLVSSCCVNYLKGAQYFLDKGTNCFADILTIKNLDPQIHNLVLLYSEKKKII